MKKLLIIILCGYLSAAQYEKEATKVAKEVLKCYVEPINYSKLNHNNN
ncbi:hypothetical protein [Campylobacter sputorum]|nr:hypothetical protein [Campylobacter sputorum]